jgi:hypothetical protein
VFDEAQCRSRAAHRDAPRGDSECAACRAIPRLPDQSAHQRCIPGSRPTGSPWHSAFANMAITPERWLVARSTACRFVWSAANLPADRCRTHLCARARARLRALVRVCACMCVRMCQRAFARWHVHVRSWSSCDRACVRVAAASGTYLPTRPYTRSDFRLRRCRLSAPNEYRGRLQCSMHTCMLVCMHVCMHVRKYMIYVLSATTRQCHGQPARCDAVLQPACPVGHSAMASLPGATQCYRQPCPVGHSAMASLPGGTQCYSQPARWDTVPRQTCPVGHTCAAPAVAGRRFPPAPARPPAPGCTSAKARARAIARTRTNPRTTACRRTRSPKCV